MSFLANNLEFIAFIAFLSIFLLWKRKNLEIQGTPILYMMLYRTKLGLNKMKSWSKKHPRLFSFLARLSYFVGVYGMIIMIFLSFWSLYIIFEQNLPTGGGLVLPIQTGDTGANGISEGPVPIFYVPFWYWLIAIFILAIVHEFAHGVIAQRYNVSVKSSGFAFLGIIVPILPAAFVEPDDEVMKKKKRWKQIAVLGAGSTSNFIFGILFLLMWIFLTAPLVNLTMTPDEITFSSTLNKSSLNTYNISSGSIVSFNGINDSQRLLDDELPTLDVNTTYPMVINTGNENKSLNITTFANAQDSSRGMIGISGLQYNYKNTPGYQWLNEMPLQLHQLLFYIWLLNIGIGMMNLLPLWITDGGRISYLLFESKFSQKKSLLYNNLVSFFVLGILIISIWPDIIKTFMG